METQKRSSVDMEVEAGPRLVFAGSFCPLEVDMQVGRNIKSATGQRMFSSLPHDTQCGVSAHHFNINYLDGKWCVTHASTRGYTSTAVDGTMIPVGVAVRIGEGSVIVLNGSDCLCLRVAGLPVDENEDVLCSTQEPAGQDDFIASTQPPPARLHSMPAASVTTVPNPPGTRPTASLQRRQRRQLQHQHLALRDLERRLEASDPSDQDRQALRQHHTDLDREISHLQNLKSAAFRKLRLKDMQLHRRRDFNNRNRGDERRRRSRQADTPCRFGQGCQRRRCLFNHPARTVTRC